MISAFGRVTKGLLKGLEDLEDGGQTETIQTTALLRTASPGHLRRLAVTQAPADMKNYQWDNNNSNCKTKINCHMNGLCNLKNIIY